MFKLNRFFDGSLILMLIAAVITGWTFFTEEDEDHQHLSIEHVVDQGDSIWSIAERVSQDIDLQLEETVYWMKHENDLEGEVIHPGQTIQIPAEWNGVASD